MDMRKSFFAIWWYYRTEEQKEILRGVGTLLFLIVIGFVMLFGAYFLHLYGVIDLEK